jgi:uncharacterized membrane protein YqaE (UPF0057 family)
MIKKITAIALLSALLFSCSTSNDVVSNGFFQKRKYTKGWHSNKFTKIKANKENNIPEVSQNEEIAQEVVVEKRKLSDVGLHSVSDQFVNKKENVSVKKTLLVLKEKSKKDISNEVAVSVQDNALALDMLKKVTEIEPAQIKENNNAPGDTSSNGHPMILLYLLAIFIPPVAVGLVTDWAVTPTVSNLLWCLLCGIPGIIHAFIKIGEYR